MTDTETIKALKCCIGRKKCKKCPAFKDCVQDTLAVEKAALNLINRQKAEIERLEKLALERHLHIQQQKRETEELRQTRYFEVRAEAKKELAEQIIVYLDESAEGVKGTPMFVSIFRQMKEAVKEMAGDIE